MRGLCVQPATRSAQRELGTSNIKRGTANANEVSSRIPFHAANHNRDVVGPAIVERILQQVLAHLPR